MEFLGNTEELPPTTLRVARLFKVYCYRTLKTGVRERQIWFEAEDCYTGQGVSWSPDREIAIAQATAIGYSIVGDKRLVVKLYLTKE